MKQYSFDIMWGGGEWEERGGRPEKVTWKLMSSRTGSQFLKDLGGRAFQIGMSKCKGPEVSQYIGRRERRPVWQEARGWGRRQGGEGRVADEREACRCQKEFEF